MAGVGVAGILYMMAFAGDFLTGSTGPVLGDVVERRRSMLWRLLGGTFERVRRNRSTPDAENIMATSPGESISPRMLQGPVPPAIPLDHSFERRLANRTMTL